MKHLVRFVVLLVTWPLLVLFLLILGIAWVIADCYGSDDTVIFAKDMKSLAYRIWHFKKREKEDNGS